MKEYIVTQKYNLGQEVNFNNQVYRVTAFRFEVRPMGIFKVYEISNGEGEHSDVTESSITAA